MLHYSHLAARMIWRKVFGIPSMLGGWWFCVGEPDDHPFFQSIHSAKYPSFSSSFSSNHTGTKWLVGHPVEFNQFHTPTRGDDLCLSFCLILNLWLLYTQLHKVWQIEAWFLSPLHYSISRRNPSKDMSTYWPIRALHVPYLLVQVITEERVKKNMRVF